MCACACMCMCVCVCVREYVVHAHPHTHKHIDKTRTQTHTRIHTRVHTHTHIHTRTLARARTHTHTHTHTLVYTHEKKVCVVYVFHVNCPPCVYNIFVPITNKLCQKIKELLAEYLYAGSGKFREIVGENVRFPTFSMLVVSIFFV